MEKAFEIFVRSAAPVFASSETLPLCYRIGGESYSGIPAEFNPKTVTKRADPSFDETTVEGVDPKTGLLVRFMYKTYRDFAAVEWRAEFTNTSDKPTPRLSRAEVGMDYLPCDGAVLRWSNGDPACDEAFEFREEDIAAVGEKRLAPVGGKPCNGVWPYFRVRSAGFGYNIAIGWGGQWAARFMKRYAGFGFAAGQETFDTAVNPGETFVTPSVTLQAYGGDNDAGVNAWRRFYFAHVLPYDGAKPIGPKVCVHNFGKWEEFTLNTEETEVTSIRRYRERGLDFDVWWIDAGWYPCLDENDGKRHWPNTGTWVADPVNFPRGLGSVGEECRKGGSQLLLWFEPERASKSHWDPEVPEKYLLRHLDENGEPQGWLLLNLGDPEAWNWVTNRIDRLIKEYNVGVYRQDFNMLPLDHWLSNDEPGRSGAIENRYVQGYYAYWDELLRRNPGLWIDSCASGGQRNDIDTMRRSVPLQYSDFGIGKPLVRQGFSRAMFEWIPYFRCHTWSTEPGDEHVGNYSCHSSFVPALTCMIQSDDETEAFEYSKKFIKLWRPCAEIMLDSDFYSLSPYSKASDSFYCVEFIKSDGTGIIHTIRNADCPEEKCTAFPKALDPSEVYNFKNPETGESFSMSGATAMEQGIHFNNAPKQGAVWHFAPHAALCTHDDTGA